MADRSDLAAQLASLVAAEADALARLQAANDAAAATRAAVTSALAVGDVVAAEAANGSIPVADASVSSANAWLTQIQGQETFLRAQIAEIDAAKLRADLLTKVDQAQQALDVDTDAVRAAVTALQAAFATGVASERTLLMLINELRSASTDASGYQIFAVPSVSSPVSGMKQVVPGLNDILQVDAARI